MELVSFWLLALTLFVAALCVMVLPKVSRTARIAEELNARIPVFEQVAGALPGGSRQGFAIKWRYLWPR